MGQDRIKAVTAANKRAWEASAHLHERGEAWTGLLSAAGKPGFSVLDEELTALLGAIGIAGRRAVQVGCNNARELLSLAALGALPALGIDQSPAFLDQGRRLAEAAGLAPRLLEADVYDLPPDLGRYDLVLITIGVLNWMPDLPAFFGIVAGLMAEGAVLVVYETHPFLEVFDPSAERPHEPAFSYFDRSPQAVTEAIAYDGRDHGAGETGYWFIHPLGDIVTACVGAGLGLVSLKEYPQSIREPEYDIYADRAAQLPMSYSLVARR